MPTTPSIPNFIDRWKPSGGAERSNYQLFLSELCDLLAVPRPQPAQPDNDKNTYVFDRAVAAPQPDGSAVTNYIDLYKANCFVLETKQGVEAEQLKRHSLLPTDKAMKKGHGLRGSRAWDDALLRAKAQAENYVKLLPADNPPFVIVVDVGHSIELYSDFSRMGKVYTPFPDATCHRILLPSLADEKLRTRLSAIFTDPLSLDPSRHSAKVTREIAAHLATLAKSLEADQHPPESVAFFLMRCLFTLFAEDVRLIPADSFTNLLKSLRDKPDQFPHMVHQLWAEMDKGGFSVILRHKLLRFNGSLFAEADALPLTTGQLDILILAGEADWQDVEPAIFGTLLERALNPIERHKLGAHHTPRAYVERLVLPTIIEPLREDWASAQAAAFTLARSGKMEPARAEIHDFLKRLCNIIVLDPACGTANFLYVTLEHLKRLEGEVRDTLRQLGEHQLPLEFHGLTVDPHQLRGLEINPRAAAIADLVLWIGYLQWHFRTHGNTAPAEPVLKKFNNIEHRDALITYDEKKLATDDHGKPLSRWDGRTYKKHPVTGEDVPDEDARTPVYVYVNPKKAEWPKADFVIGNPPFIGKLYMLSALGEGYAQAVRSAYEQSVPDGADFVMYWWQRAAELASQRKIRRFGLITTKAINQAYNRRVVVSAIADEAPVHLVFAIPNHPWADGTDSAAVRIAMTAAEAGTGSGDLFTVLSEGHADDDEAPTVTVARMSGVIHPDLRIGVNILEAASLASNSGIAGTGLILGSRGFVLETEEEKTQYQNPRGRRLIFPLRNGRDITDRPRGHLVIDTDGWSELDLRNRAPEIYQRLLERVYPERQTNRDARLRANWWLFRRTNEQVRSAIGGLARYIITPETARHRIFVFLDSEIKPEHKLVVVGSDDAYVLGVLSSRGHVQWALAAGGRLGVGNDPTYSKNTCFDPFPFPLCPDAQQQRIRELGEALDAHRKRQQAQFPDLTLTDMYNVLEKLRIAQRPGSLLPGSSIQPLSQKEKQIHDHALVSVLKQIHDDLDAAVIAAYGWPATLTDEQILERLVALNHERAAEEKRGLVRYLRPDFQNPAAAPKHVQAELDLGSPDADEPPPKAKRKSAKGKTPAPSDKQEWPPTLAEQAKAIRIALAAHPGKASAEDLARMFLRAPTSRVEELIETLVSLGHVREVADGLYTA